MTDFDVKRELQALFHGVGLVDQRAMTRMHAGGADFLPLLGRLSTADVATIPKGELRPTVLTTPKGRIVAQLLLWSSADGVGLLSGPGLASSISDHIAQFTFAEKVDLRRTDESTFHLALIGPSTGAVLESLELAHPGSWRVSQQEIAGVAVDLIGHDGHSAEGLSLLGARDDLEAVHQVLAGALERAGGCPVDAHAIQLWRILRGLPAAGQELTDQFNPLEAGLDQAISFTKGCYVGQEVIARLHSYDKVSRRIVGVELGKPAQPPACGAALNRDGRTVGVVTSRSQLPGDGNWIGLAFMKLKALESTAPVTLDDGSPVEIVELPFPATTRPGP